MTEIKSASQLIDVANSLSADLKHPRGWLAEVRDQVGALRPDELSNRFYAALTQAGVPASTAESHAHCLRSSINKAAKGLEIALDAIDESARGVADIAGEAAHCRKRAADARPTTAIEL